MHPSPVPWMRDTLSPKGARAIILNFITPLGRCGGRGVGSEGIGNIIMCVCISFQSLNQ